MEAASSSPELGLLPCLGSSLLLAVAYVLSLYVWRSPHDRDHPDTIRRRFLSALFMAAASPAFTWLFAPPSLLARHGLSAVIGLRWSGLLPACVLPLLLTLLLFLGPLATLVTDEASLQLILRPFYWRRALSDLIWWRNHVVAPLSEELTFRACMLPILLGHFSARAAAVVSPLLFGVAHLHHLSERLRKGQPPAEALLISLFQMGYTSVFGVFSAFLFLRSGHLLAPVVAHGFCNFMGFPDLGLLFARPPQQRLLLSLVYLAGVVLFFLALFPLTEPGLFANHVFVW